MTKTHRARRTRGGWSRRRFAQAPLALAAAAWLPATAARAARPGGGRNLEAYASATSVRPGARLTFHARNPQAGRAAGTFPMTITRIGAPDTTVLATTVTIGRPAVPADASTAGCGWPVTHALDVPAAWPSGLYFAAFGSGDTACFVPFVVRPAERRQAVLLQVPVTTAQAYNAYGGKSLYEYNSTQGVRAPQVSFERPLDNPWNNAFDPWQPALIRWLEQRGIAVDYATSIDLHRDAALLAGYQLMITAGHDEYWTREMRQRLDAFVAGGGNAAIFSGNTCWWQARLAAGASGAADRVLVCTKSAATDPVADPALKTVNWFDPAVAWPENASIGLGSRSGAIWTASAARPATPYVVHERAHWAFAGLTPAQLAGFGGTQVGYETDAAAFRSGADGRPYRTGADGTPATLRILAQADASNWESLAGVRRGQGAQSGYAAIATFSRGGGAGTVFNVGTTDWTYALASEPTGAIAVVTANVVARLSQPWRERAAVLRWSAGSDSFLTIGTEVPPGMALAGQAFLAASAPEAGTLPVYRFRAADGGSPRCRLSVNPTAPAGYTANGVAFHAWSSNTGGMVPIVQARRIGADGRTSFSYGPAAPADWIDDGVAFYVPAG